MKWATKQGSGSRSFAWGFAERAAAVRRRSRSCAAERSAREKRHRDLTVAARRGGSCVRGSKRRGAALLLVIFAMAFIAVLAVAVLDVAATDLGILRNHQNGLTALYAAQGGLNQAVSDLRGDCLKSGSLGGTWAAPDGTTCRFEARIENLYPLVTVTSTGKAAGFVRTVQARVVVAGPPFKAPFPVRVEWWREVAGVSLIP